MRIHKTTIWWTSPVFLCLMLIMFITCPVLTPGTYADTTKTSTTDSHVSIALTGSTVLDLQPDVSDGFSYSTSDLVISTSSTAGFKVMLSSSDQGNLISPDTTDSNLIQSLTQASTPDDFAPNSWGYYLGTADPDSTSTYEPIPSEAAVILDTDIATDASYKLAFGAKVDYDLPAGVYHTTLLVSAVANPTTLGALDQITYMQEMTPEICANTTNYVDKDHYATKQLIDSRDNKSYWVAKLADGNCWMVQNLALTFGTGTGKVSKLTPNDSDVGSEWKPEETRTWSGSGASDGQAVSWSFPSGSNGTQLYYTLDAATAGSGGNGTGKLAPYSICPKGWKLPLAGPNNDNVNGSFYNLLSAYGVNSTLTSTAGTYEIYQPDGETVTYNVSNGQYNIMEEPLSFMKAGIVAAGGSLINIDSVGDLWSATYYGGPDIKSYALTFGDTVGSSNTRIRKGGCNVRCLAR